MSQLNLSYFFKMGTIQPMNSGQLPDGTCERTEGFAKAPILHELGRIVRSAYEQGVTLEEANAICGAAYGDWREEQDARVQGRLQVEVAPARR